MVLGCLGEFDLYCWTVSRLPCESRFSVTLSRLTIARGLVGMAGEITVRLEPESSPASFTELPSARPPDRMTGGRTEPVEAGGQVDVLILACGEGRGASDGAVRAEVDRPTGFVKGASPRDEEVEAIESTEPG